MHMYLEILHIYFRVRVFIIENVSDALKGKN